MGAVKCLTLVLFISSAFFKNHFNPTKKSKYDTKQHFTGFKQLLMIKNYYMLL